MSDSGSYIDASRDLAFMGANKPGDEAFEPGDEVDIHNLPPEQPSLSPQEWLKKNLFSSWGNSLITILFLPLVLPVGWLISWVPYLGSIYPDRGLLGVLLDFVFSEERDWNAVRTNLRLLFTQAYPDSDFIRVWIVVGLAVVLAGLSAGLWQNWGGVSLKRISIWLMSTGSIVVLGVVSREPSVVTDADGGRTIDEATGEFVRESFADAMADRVVWWIIGLVLVGAGLGLWYGLGDKKRRSTFVPVTAVVFGLLGAIVASTWVVRYGHYAFADGEFIAEPGRTVARSTKLPWTVMWVLLVASYFVGKYIRHSPLVSATKGIVNLLWLLTPFIGFWVVLRSPVIDWGRVASVDAPMFLAFAVAGAVVLFGLSATGIGEVGRLAAIALLVVALGTWAVGGLGWFSMLQKARISFLVLALFALAASAFSGDQTQRRKFVAAWVLAMFLVHFFATVINSPSAIKTPTGQFLGGFSITVFVAVMTVMFSFPLGVLLALARTSSMPIFRVLATAYIETIRGVPLITILIFFSIMLNLFLPGGMSISELAAVTVGYTMFSAAYLAENVRGGLQAIRRGQYEASDALGLTTVQRTGFIVLPQALRVSIPPLVGQVIATFKETSLLYIIGVFDFLFMANKTIPAQTEFLGVRREGLLFVSVVYWVVAFAMSKYSQRLEKRLGVGER
ncbi:MAG: amino acid ABC transporter permease [Acidimicrobiales bacterium]